MDLIIPYICRASHLSTAVKTMTMKGSSIYKPKSKANTPEAGSVKSAVKSKKKLGGRTSDLGTDSALKKNNPQETYR